MVIQTRMRAGTVVARRDSRCDEERLTLGGTVVDERRMRDGKHCEQSKGKECSPLDVKPEDRAQRKGSAK